MNISDKLNKIIQFDLADGVLIEKEKSILLKNDKEEGIDEDEFEMYLCSLLFEKKQIPKREAVSEMLRPPFVEKLTLNKDRDTKKCPRCGECRHGFRNSSSMSTSKFIEKLSKESIHIQKGFLITRITMATKSMVI